ncbi:N/A [soil metagenome]
MSNPQLRVDTPEVLTNPSPRIGWLDTFRGMTILLVVVGHVLGGLAFSSFVSEENRARLWAAYHLLYTFRMPALFIASGLFVARSLRRGLPRFLDSKFRTLAYPYLLWSLLGWGVHSIASGMTNTPADPLAPLKMLYDPLKGVWFLYVLFVVMLIYGLWAWSGKGRLGFLALGIVAHLAVPLLESVPTLPALVAQYAVYLGLGLVLADHVGKFSIRLSARRLVILTPLSFLAMKGAVALGFEKSPSLDLLPALAGTAGLFGAAMLIDRLPIAETLRHWGRHSLSIYLAGGHASVATRLILFKGLGLTALAPHLVLGGLAGLLGPLALVACCRWIGFGYLFSWPAATESDPDRTRSPARHPVGLDAGLPTPSRKLADRAEVA